MTALVGEGRLNLVVRYLGWQDDDSREWLLRLVALGLKSGVEPPRWLGRAASEQMVAPAAPIVDALQGARQGRPRAPLAGAVAADYEATVCRLRLEVKKRQSVATGRGSSKAARHEVATRWEVTDRALSNYVTDSRAEGDPIATSMLEEFSRRFEAEFADTEAFLTAFSHDLHAYMTGVCAPFIRRSEDGSLELELFEDEQLSGYVWRCIDAQRTPVKVTSFPDSRDFRGTVSDCGTEPAA